MIPIASLKVSSVLLAVPLLFIFLAQTNSCRNSSNAVNTTNATKETTVTKDTAVTTRTPVTRDAPGIPIRVGSDAGPDVWGGEHIRLRVVQGGAQVEYDCAEGIMTEPLVTDARGHFDIKGRHRAEHSGPIRRTEEEYNGRPARYTGKIVGDTMTLTVTLTDKPETFGNFTLKKGSEGNVYKCR